MGISFPCKEHIIRMKDRWEEANSIERQVRKDVWAKVSVHIKKHWIPYVIILIIGSLDLWFRYFTYWCDRC